MGRPFILLSIWLLASPWLALGQPSQPPVSVREVLRACGCLASDMPTTLLDTQVVDHAVLKQGDSFVAAFWTSLEWDSKDPLGVIAGDVATGKWQAERLPLAQDDRSPIASITRVSDLVFINLAYSIDDYAIPVLSNSLRLRGTIYGTFREVWPNGIVYYDVHQPRFGPHTIRLAVFDPQSAAEREIYPPKPCQPVRCGYAGRLIKAGAGPVPWIQASGAGAFAFNWSRRAQAFLARFKQEYPLVTPSGWTEELVVMVVCDGLDRVETSACRETPLDEWRAAFPGVPDSELVTRAAANPTRIMP